VDDYVAMLGHELRNPLGAIAAAADVLETAPPASASAAQARAVIGRQTRQFAHRMDDLLDLGRLLAGRLAPVRTPVDLAAVARHACDAFATSAEAQDPRVVVEGGAAWADADGPRLELVLVHLLDGAMRRAPPDRPVVVTAAQRGTHAVLEVRSDGLDAPAGLEGSGLALLQRLADLHGASLTVDDGLSGIRVALRLPAIEPPATESPDALPPSRRRRVLVMEDDSDASAALRSELERVGHTDITVADGIEGLSRLLRQQPEVSIVNVGLRGLTGYEVARHARAAGYAGRMIALSGLGQPGDAGAALVAGFDACLSAPVQRDQLCASLDGG
jgi:CheY-like chemotaxis protein